MSEENALWLQTTSRGMSRTGYQDLRATLQQNQLAELPGWNKTKDYRDQVCSNLNVLYQGLFSYFQFIVPKISFTEESQETVAAQFDVHESLINHTERLFDMIEVEPGNFKFTVRFSWDGAKFSSLNFKRKREQHEPDSTQ